MTNLPPEDGSELNFGSGYFGYLHFGDPSYAQKIDIVIKTQKRSELSARVVEVGITTKTLEHALLKADVYEQRVQIAEVEVI